MLISKEKMLIFAAFNKTGSTSIEAALNSYNSRLLYYRLMIMYRFVIRERRLFKHARPAQLKVLLGEREWDRYFKVSFVRNPWDRTVSLYNYHKKNPNRYPLAQRSFEEWLLGGGTGTVKKSMVEFISDNQGRIIMDYVGRYENLEENFSYICQKVNLPNLSLAHLNQSSFRGYRDYYTQTSKRIVEEWAAKDIAAFGYTFED